jgi:hypothetical protein
VGDHDVYGKTVMRRAVGAAFSDGGSSVEVRYGSKRGATIDGVVGDAIAVEIESRVSKQVRGAVLDLICHRCPKKLLILVPVHMSNAELCSDQCRDILGRFVPTADFRVVVLAGSGFVDAMEADARLVRHAVSELGLATPPAGNADA